MNAHAEVATALRDGRLTRQPCEECGAEKTMAHHDDYAKPLEVRWLCGSHHKRWHAENDAKNWGALRDFRRRFPYSQQEIADLIGVSRRSVQNWEYGMTPKPHHRRRLEEFIAQMEVAA